MDNYNYPEGSDTPNAPWNQVDPPKKEFTVTATFSLDKEIKVHTSDYTQDVDWDEDDGKVACIDTSDTNWIKAYQEEHETVEDLLKEFKTLLEAKIEECENFSEDKNTLKRYKYLKSECEGWVTHDFEVVE
jgi:hypothetical protein